MTDLEYDSIGRLAWVLMLGWLAYCHTWIAIGAVWLLMRVLS